MDFCYSQSDTNPNSLCFNPVTKEKFKVSLFKQFRPLRKQEHRLMHQDVMRGSEEMMKTLTRSLEGNGNVETYRVSS